MNEMTESGAKARNKGAKKPGKAEDASVEGQVGRMLVRAIWAQEWSVANPDAKPEERKAAWKDNRAAMMELHLKPYRRALTALTRSGVMLTMNPAAAAAAGEDAGDDAGDDA